MGAALVLLLVGLGAMAAGVLIGRYYVPDDRQLRRTARHSKAYMRALSHLVARDHDTVITELRTVVEENVEDAEPYFALGAIFRSRGEHERAIRVHQALALRERDKRKLRQRAMYELGLDFRAAGMPRRATRAMEEVVVQEPGHEGALRVLAALYEEQARFNEAAGLWQRLGRRRGEDTSHREHHLLVAAAQTALGRDDLDSAKQLLKTAQKHQESAHFFAAAAELAAARGNHRGAKERLKQALIAEPGLAPHLLPGLIAAEQGLSGEAADRNGSDELDDEVAAEAARLAADSRLALPAGTGDLRRTPSQPLVALSSTGLPSSAGSALPHAGSPAATSSTARLPEARPGRATQVGVAAVPATPTVRAAATAGASMAGASMAGASMAGVPMAGVPAAGAPTAGAPTGAATAGPTATGASTAGPAAGPTTAGPTTGTATAGTATAGTATAGTATAGAPTAGAPTAGAPTVGAPTAGAPTVGAPTVGTPAVGAPTVGTPTVGAPTGGTQTRGPTTAGSATAGTMAADNLAASEISQTGAASAAVGPRGTLSTGEAAAIASHGSGEGAALGVGSPLDDGRSASAAEWGGAEPGWVVAEESALVRSQRGRATADSAASSSSRSPTLHGVALVPAQRPSASVSDRVLAVLAEIEAQSGPRLELALIRAQLVPPQDTADRAALARELIARFPDALAARVASARLAIASGDPDAIRGALEALVSDGGALAWTLRGRWQCAHCGHRPGPFSWRCGQCRRWGTLRMETGVEPPPLPPRERRAAPRVARPDALLGASPDESLPAATLDPGLSDAELATAGARRSLLGRVGGWVSGVWRRGA